ncbi:Uroporphyrinogen-III synthase (EC 4.2.1.75) [uncultured Gammaproteobacteria bacterium]|nr:Uroporphyrinogen-III synthase (EC 4.2.1.75) [uncultured Gammaproteobacteria bacterium]CAC9439126.1 Uroporphyrinogen-III synthase (EC 4.2.1.75) [uncultured Gammaproteobacteria bacterium]SMN13536.1 Uroporphyrinogen-III synthase [Bathymodiolus heckerae thiotrophic gill symbiont]
MNVLLTRALLQVEKLQSMVVESGNTPLLFPTLKLNSITTKATKNNYDAVIFISANAVEHGLNLLKTINYHQIFAVGSTTAKKLNESNISVDDFPKNKASSEALLAMPAVQKLKNQNILIFRGEGGRETLKQGLEKHNTVEYIEVYQRVVCHITSLHRQTLSQFLQSNQGIITATSVENLSALLSMVEQIDADALNLIKRYPLAVLGERIKTFAQSAGFSQIKVAPKTSDTGLLKAIQCSS